MADYLSEATTVRAAPETTRGSHPTTDWRKLQVDVGGVQGFERTQENVTRNVFSVNATDERGDIIKYDVTAQIVHDVNKEFCDLVLPAVFRANAKHLGGSGLSFFRPTAVVDGGVGDDSFTVGASGNIAANRLIRTRGFTNAANNNTFVTVASADPLAIKVATGTLTAEASPPANATLDVVGLQGPANDIGLSAGGHLTSAGGTNFTTMGLVVGMWIYLPTPAEATAMGSALYAFSSAVAPTDTTQGTNCGYARITAISATQLTLERHNFTIVADPGTGAGEIIRVFCMSRFFRNWPLDDTTNTHATSSLSFEKEDIKPGVAADTRYTYIHGCGAPSLSIAAPLNSKITATLSLIGMTATEPLATASRKSGPSAAYEPLADATDLVDAQNDVKRVRLGDSTGAKLTEFNELTWEAQNGITPKGILGRLGAADLNFGKFHHRVTSFQGYHSDSDVIKAAYENRSGMWWDMAVRNKQFGWLIDMPHVAIHNPTLTYAGDQPVMLSGELVGLRNATDGIQGSFGVFGWLPSA